MSVTAGSTSEGGAPAVGGASTSVSGSADVGGTSGAGGGPSGGASGATTAGGAGGALADDPGTAGDGSFMIGPQYADAPEYKRGAGVPQGKTFTFSFAAKTSMLYPKAIDRKVTVHVPTQYMTGTLALANERLALALKGHNYHYHFDLAQGGTHVDQRPLRQTLPTGLTLAVARLQSRDISSHFRRRCGLARLPHSTAPLQALDSGSKAEVSLESNCSSRIRRRR